MDLIYPSSGTIHRSRSSTTWGNSGRVSLILVALATAMSVVNIALSVVRWERSRSYADVSQHMERQAVRTTTGGGICVPCLAILGDSSSEEEREFVESYFKGEWLDASNIRSSTGLRDKSELRKDNDDVCCTKNRHHLLILLQMIRRRKQNDQGLLYRRSCIIYPSVESSINGTLCILDKTEAADSAHLTKIVASKSDSGMLEWTESSAMRGKVKNIRGQLTSEVGGIYFVYSQVYFVDYGDDKTTRSDRGTTKDTVTVFLHRRVNRTARSEVVSKRSERRCSHATFESVCEYSVYVGSLVKLATSGAVYVTVSHPSMINDDVKFTYFGLYKIA